MADQHTAAASRSATVTVTLRDGTSVDTLTWDTCAGVGRFVADLLGEPTACHTADAPA